MRFFLCALSSIFLSLIFCGGLIPLLKKKKAKQVILSYVEEHQSKSGTPTMGGIGFFLSIVICSLVFCFGASKPMRVALVVSLGAFAIGFLDDYIKISYGRNLGLRAYQKIVTQIVLAVVVGVYAFGVTQGELLVPFWNEYISIGYWIIPLSALAFIATVNTVNLTDGLDGLASSVSMTYAFFLAILLAVTAFELNLSGQITKSSEYLNFLILAISFIGSMLGFLFFNTFPAMAFMGDTGSLFIGGILATMTIFTKFTLFLPVFGFVFVISGVSDILQVAYFKLTGGKRIFKMAPFHHHLQHLGMHENRIVKLYVIVSVVISLVAIYLFVRKIYGI